MVGCEVPMVCEAHVLLPHQTAALLAICEVAAFWWGTSDHLFSTEMMASSLQSLT